jgi:glycosyltransferase involved in cell wall biosynthesis
VIDFIGENNPILASQEGPLVAILMGTMNGVRFLSEQLDSLQTQTHQNWVLIASDDGSTDDTINILKAYQAKWSEDKLIIKKGPGIYYPENFLSLACDPAINAQYYAFCDQDDVWLPNKLESGITQIQKVEQDNSMVLYCSRTTYVNDKLEYIGESPLFVFPKTFRNAIVQSIAGGNTMIFNQATKNLLERVCVLSAPSHDWWVYCAVTAVGGEVIFDEAPKILYRQHQEALIGGENKSIPAKIERVIALLFGRFKNWNSQNITALERLEPMMTKDNQKVFQLFKVLRNANIIGRIRLIEVCGLYRQTRRGTLSLYMAAILKKI